MSTTELYLSPIKKKKKIGSMRRCTMTKTEMKKRIDVLFTISWNEGECPYLLKCEYCPINKKASRWGCCTDKKALKRANKKIKQIKEILS